MGISANSLEIVTATVDDLAQLVPLFDGYRQFYKQASDLEGAHRFLAAHFAHGTSVIFLALCATAEGQRSTCGFTQLYPGFSSVSLKPLWTLNDLFVVPDARRLGVGRALLSHAHAFAASTGARGLTLKTAVDNVCAQALYEATGWQRDEQFYTYNLYF
ncbi:MAG TPA: GNAT family N-acetyltransferase [Ktedonobacteraceae bacterium]|jgi:GNAT superfamily N-acetyltransferase